MSLIAWSESALTAIVEAKDESAFSTAFENLFSRNATFYDNGVSQTRDEYVLGLLGTGSKYDSQSIKFIQTIDGGDGSLAALYEITGVKKGSANVTIQVFVNAKTADEGGAKKVVFLSQVTTPH
ncbi:hypothetical protein K439DRAFT_1659279 [Ramaria rubella]|nr:hypothetical protein K439DRAFT_1659279 [Ramaria rubella]